MTSRKLGVTSQKTWEKGHVDDERARGLFVVIESRVPSVFPNARMPRALISHKSRELELADLVLAR